MPYGNWPAYPLYHESPIAASCQILLYNRQPAVFHRLMKSTPAVTLQTMFRCFATVYVSHISSLHYITINYHACKY